MFRRCEVVAADAQAEGAAAVTTSDPAFVSVIGASRATPELAGRAAELGELLAEPHAVVVCGGRSGVMEVRAGGEVIIAVGGAWGTPSEIVLARNVAREVILLDAWAMEPTKAGRPNRVRRASAPAKAVEAVEPAPVRQLPVPKRQPGGALSWLPA